MKSYHYAYLWSFLLLAAIFLVAPAQLSAQDIQVPEGPLVSTMTGFLVEKNDQGAETLTKIDQVKPGQIVQYALEYKNISDRALAEVSILGPIPAGTVYQSGSAITTANAKPEFSIDDGDKFQPEPVTYKVKQADGTEKELVATPDMYTHIRWNVGTMTPQQRLTLTYRVQVR